MWREPEWNMRVARSPGVERGERKGFGAHRGRSCCLAPQAGPGPEGVPLAEAGRVTLGSVLQIGSYFGASLCSVDVDRDGSSDLVLIGAPHYYDSTRGGQVSVCPLPRGVSG